MKARAAGTSLAALFLAASVSIADDQAQQQPQPQQAPQKAAPAEKKFGKDQLEQIVAPIALYPDNLLAQILAASTYPVDIVEAARWVKHNPDLSQDDKKEELQLKKWDPSVKGLVFFPQLLQKLNDNLDWTNDLGAAFLSQQKDVMDTIQEMRAKAKQNGNLNSSDKQSVTTNSDGSIQVQSTTPDTVYVQNYEPATAYGTSWAGGGYYPAVIAAPAWPWGFYGAGWACGYWATWDHGWIGYNNNYYNSWHNWNNWHNWENNWHDWNNHYINPNKYGPHNLYDPKNQDNHQWQHDTNRTRPVTPSTQQIARNLENEHLTPQNFRGNDQRAAENLRQGGFGENQRPETARNEAVRGEHTFNEAGRGEEGYHPFSGSGDGNLERRFSDRGSESRGYSGYSGYHGSYHGSGGGRFGGGHGGGRR